MTHEKKTTHQDSAYPKGRSDTDNTMKSNITDFFNEQLELIDSNNVNIPDKEGDPATSLNILNNTENLGKSLSCNETDKIFPIPKDTSSKQAPLHS